jgi:hypothetical protein
MAAVRGLPGVGPPPDVFAIVMATDIVAVAGSDHR